MNKLDKFIRNTFYGLIISLFSTRSVFAQYIKIPTRDASEQALKAMLFKIFQFVWGTIGAIFVIVVIVGGIQYLTSMGNEETATKAKKTLANGIIGVTIAVAGYAISAWILKGIGGEVPNIIQP